MPARSELWTCYDRRASEYGSGILAGVDDEASVRIHDEGAEVARVLSALAPAVHLEVGAGTGLFTRHLPGRGVVLDRSAVPPISTGTWTSTIGMPSWPRHGGWATSWWSSTRPAPRGGR